MPETNSTSITVYITPWCGDCRRALAYLAAQHIPHVSVDIEKDPAAMALVKQINRGNRSVPTIVFADGSTLTEPTTSQLARKLGLPA
jgi:mycoredoxin